MHYYHHDETEWLLKDDDVEVTTGKSCTVLSTVLSTPVFTLELEITSGDDQWPPVAYDTLHNVQ